MTENLFLRPNRTNTKIVADLSTLGQVGNNLQALNLTAGEIPERFTDWIDKKKLSPMQDQQLCGSCWAMSSTSCLSDRFMIAKGIKLLDLNPLVPVSCSTKDAGCDGGFPSNCGEFFETHGVPKKSDTCTGWNEFCSKNKCQNPPNCDMLNGCNNIYKAVPGSTKSLVLTNEDGSANPDLTIINIKTEIMKNGSVVCATFVPFALYDPEFWPETKGILMCGKGYYDQRLRAKFKGQVISGADVGSDKFTWDNLITDEGVPAGHAMCIVGWDYDTVNGVKVQYWIIRNSWGQKWADNGYFKYAIYNPVLGVNTYQGLDVPVKTQHGLFGGCTSFMPDVATGDENDEIVHGDEGGSGSLLSEDVKKYGLYLIYVLIALLILYGVYRGGKSLYTHYKLSRQVKMPTKQTGKMLDSIGITN